MSDSHDKLPKLFWVQLALAAFIGVMYLISPAAEKHEANTSEASTSEKSASKNLEPIGAVAVKSDKPGTDAAGRSGEEVYNGVCGTCHNTGIANAPKIDDKTAWEPRLANGLQGLIDTATKGKGAMPPNGGDPAITPDELKEAILYMTKKVGIDLSSSDKKEAKKEVVVKKAEPVKVMEQETQKADITKVAVTPSAPKAPVAPNAPEVKKVIPAPAEPIAVAAVTPKEVSQPATTKTVDLELGKKIYSSSCFACHDSGVAGSPKIGDKAAWTTRIATGAEALYAAAIKGKGVMPPKGGNNSIPDSDVTSAVDYMISMSK